MTSITEEECSICFEKLENEIAHLSCNHFFHYHCIGNWIKKNQYNNITKINCPLCNQEFEILNIYLPKKFKTKIQKNKIAKHEGVQLSKYKCNIL
jgi:hypothetical protein